MSFEKSDLLYEGKAKKIYQVKDRDDLVWVEYKDSLTAFNAQKKSSFENKGEINQEVTSILFNALEKAQVRHHLVSRVGEKDLVCLKVSIIPLEVVVRNTLAGSTAKKLGIEEGRKLDQPLVEFYFKDDSLGDPFVSDDQALMIKAVGSQKELDEMKSLALKINQRLKEIFHKVGIDLIDFKIELGRTPGGELLLADEITPDTCRLWDLKTGEKLDKDRFRRDLGKIKESYEEVLMRLKKWEKESQ